MSERRKVWKVKEHQLSHKYCLLKKEIETTKILKKSISANRALERCESVNFILDTVFRGEL